LLVFTLFIFWKTKNKVLFYFKVVNLYALLIFLYSILLGLYFQNFFMGEFVGDFPSRIISVWCISFFYSLYFPLILFMVFSIFIKK